ncbi:GNAT family N-acetyltransferase [Geodermatophilus sp. SYSU D00815]
MIVVDAGAVAGFFAPERPGPLIHQHVLCSGVGRCAADRWPGPSTALAELPGDNVAVRGLPRVLPKLRGLVEAPPEWLPVLREVDPGLVVWDRLVAVLPESVGVPAPAAAVRRLGAGDAAALEGLDPSIAWIGETWDGAAGLAASGHAWAAFDGARPVAVACSFFVGQRHEDIGVVTERGSRGRGLSRACVAALVGDIRARGRRPTWTTSPDNLASRAVAARLGFVHERDDVLYAVRTPVPPVD